MNQDRICSALERALERKGHYPGEERRRDIAFHLTDWLADLQDWHRFCESPDSFSAEEINKLVIAFLLHVPNHLAAASKLMLDIPVTDVFDVGAVESDS